MSKYTPDQYAASAAKHGIPCGPWRSHTGGTPHCDATRGDVFHLCDDAEFDRIRDTLASLPDLLIALDEMAAEIERLRKAMSFAIARFENGPEQITNPNDPLLAELKAALKGGA